MILWSAPQKSERNNWSVVRTITILGCELPKDIRTFKSTSDNDLLIRAVPDGPAIAEVIGRRIYILADIFGLSDQLLEEKFEFILSQALEILVSNSQITQESLLAAVQNASDSHILRWLEHAVDYQNQIIQAELDGIVTEVTQLRELVQMNAHNVSRCNHSAIGEERRLRTERTDSLGPTTSDSTHPEDSSFNDLAKVEFDFIVSHPLVRYLPHRICAEAPPRPKSEVGGLEIGVTSIDLSRFLSVYTHHITTMHRTTKNLHDMGYYRMVVPIDQALQFRWFNLTRRIQAPGTEAKNHPHIYSDGHACLGNADRLLRESLLMGDIYGTIQIGLRFLTSCQVTDPAGMALDYWPLYLPDDYQYSHGS
jgi:hypothetical protein